MKKIVSLLLALMLALSLAACSAKSASNDSASMASDSYDFNGAEMPDMEYGYTASDDGAWDGQSVSSPAADLADGEPLADGNGKRVHTQGEGCEKNRKNPHESSFLSDSEMTLIL